MVGIIAFAVGAAGLVASLIVGASAGAAVRANLTPTRLDTIRLRALDGSPWRRGGRGARDLPRVEAVRWRSCLKRPSDHWAAVFGGRATSFKRARVSCQPTPTIWRLCAAVVRQKTAASQLDSTWSSGVALLGVQTAKDLGISGCRPRCEDLDRNAGFDVAGLIRRADRDPSLAIQFVISPVGCDDWPNTDKIQTEMVVITARVRDPGLLAYRACCVPPTPQVRISTCSTCGLFRDGVSNP